MSGVWGGLNVRRMRPTLQHRQAMWECMLGTVYAMNETGEVRYFDYRWSEAHAWAGTAQDRDPRWAPKVRAVRYTNGSREGMEPRIGQKLLWILKEDTE